LDAYVKADSIIGSGEQMGETKVKTAITREGRKIEWRHPGGKFRRLGPRHCTEAELLAIILGSGSAGRSAEQIAKEVLDRYHSLIGIMGKTLGELMEIKGLKIVRATRIAACLEIARRIDKNLEKRQE
jgi:DNA repair protein RadC